MNAISRVIVSYVLNSAWQVMLITALAFLSSMYLRHLPGRYRHNLWALCLGVCLVLPAATVAIQVRSDAKAGFGVTMTEPGHPPHEPYREGGWSFLSLRSRSRPLLFTPLLINGLALSYVVLIVFRGFHLTWIYRRTSQVRRSASMRELPQSLSRASRYCHSVFGMRDVPILCSKEVSSPSTVGWSEPVLLIPEHFFREPPSEEDLISALSHEMAHIQRNDFARNLFEQVISIALCFHPAMVLIKSRIAQTRELAADEMAAGLLPSGNQYARSLLQIAQTVLADAPAARSNYAMGLFDTHVLEERIMNILRMSESTRRAGRIRMVVVCASILAVSLLSSAFSLHISADTNPGDLQRFAGTWVTKYKGQAFITLKIKPENGALHGSVVHVDRLDYVDGELIPSSNQFTEQEIVEAKVSGEKVNLRIGGHDSIYLEFTLTGPNSAEMKTAGDVGNSPDQAPPQKKPWHFQRVGEGQ